MGGKMQLSFKDSGVMMGRAIFSPQWKANGHLGYTQGNMSIRPWNGPTSDIVGIFLWLFKTQMNSQPSLSL